MNDHHADYLHVTNRVTRLFMPKTNFYSQKYDGLAAWRKKNRVPFLWFLDYPRMAIQMIILLMQIIQEVTPRDPAYDNEIACITMNASISGHSRQ